MTADLPEFSLNLAISKGMNNYFSLLQNIQIKNRKSDIDILQNKLMLTMRPWTEIVGNSVSSTGQASNTIFFTWVDWNRYQYISHWNKIYKNILWTWTDIWATLTNNNVNFNVIRLPYWNPTSVFSTSAVATWSNKVKPDVTDTNPAQKVGKYLMIVWNTSPSASDYTTTDVYRNKYSYITAYDSTNWEYLLEWLGNAEPIINGVKYQIFDKLENYLQFTNWVDDDQYYDWTDLQTIYKWRINQHFNRFIANFKPQQCFFFNGVQFTYRVWTLMRSEPLNYFWFNMTDVIDMSNFDIINEIFVWKNRLIVWWERSVTYYTYDSTLKTYIQTVMSDNYWMIKWWVNNFGKDVYFFTNNKQMISLAENQYWIVIPTNVWAVIDNYLQKLNYAICTGFDWRKFYIYWEETSWVTWTICVYDTQYNFWSTYTNLSPSKFILEKFDFYMINNKKWEVYKFVDWLFTDNTQTITQSISTMDLDWNNVFKFKESKYAYFYFENLNQDFILWTIKIWQEWQARILNEWKIEEKVSSDTTLWENLLGGVVLGWNNIINWLPLPYIIAKELWADAALLWIFTIIWKDWSPFYLNDMTFTYSLLQDYFNPSYTI